MQVKKVVSFSGEDDIRVFDKEKATTEAAPESALKQTEKEKKYAQKQAKLKQTKAQFKQVLIKQALEANQAGQSSLKCSLIHRA
jgi:formaldehyde-activating enzyme involved in methanogenesis